MSQIKPVRPEDILPDGADTTLLNGKVVRKGSVAAFIANLEILENPQATETQKNDAIQMMRELAATVNAVGLHTHVTFKNIQAEQILIDATCSAVIPAKTRIS